MRMSVGEDRIRATCLTPGATRVQLPFSHGSQWRRSAMLSDTALQIVDDYVAVHRAPRIDDGG